MQAVVPSQVVAAILRLFPQANSPRQLALNSSQLPELMAIVRLVRRVAAELFTIPIEQYVELEQSIEIIEQSLRIRDRQQYQFLIDSLRDKSVIQGFLPRADSLPR
jgi:hypothetical protein